MKQFLIVGLSLVLCQAAPDWNTPHSTYGVPKIPLPVESTASQPSPFSSYGVPIQGGSVPTNEIQGTPAAEEYPETDISNNYVESGESQPISPAPAPFGFPLEIPNANYNYAIPHAEVPSVVPGTFGFPTAGYPLPTGAAYKIPFGVPQVFFHHYTYAGPHVEAARIDNFFTPGKAVETPGYPAAGYPAPTAQYHHVPSKAAQLVISHYNYAIPHVQVAPSVEYRAPEKPIEAPVAPTVEYRGHPELPQTGTSNYEYPVPESHGPPAVPAKPEEVYDLPGEKYSVPFNNVPEAVAPNYDYPVTRVEAPRAPKPAKQLEAFGVPPVVPHSQYGVPAV